MRFPDTFLGPLLRAGLPLIKNEIKSLINCVLIPLGLAVAGTTLDADIHF